VASPNPHQAREEEENEEEGRRRRRREEGARVVGVLPMAVGAKDDADRL
jgi:hypothetical protein